MHTINYSILDVLPDAVLVIARDYSIIFANRAIASLYALRPDEIVGRYCCGLLPNISACDIHSTTPSSCGCSEVFRTGQPVTVTRRLTLPEGVMKFFAITTSPLHNDQGQVEQVVQVLRDITATVDLHQSVETCHLEFKRIFDNVPEAIVYLDREMKVLQMNPLAEKNVGIAAHEAKGKLCYELWGQYARDESRKGLDRICDGCRAGEALTTGKSYLLERQMGDRIIEVLTIPVKDHDDLVVGTMELGRDITEQKQAQQALGNSESRYRSLFDDSPMPLCVADFSAMKQKIDALMPDIGTDFPEYFAAHPGKTSEILCAFKLIDMNLACRQLLGFAEMGDIPTSLTKILKKIPLHETPEGLCALGQGKLSSSHDITLYSVGGERIHAILRWAVEPGSEQTYNRVLLSLDDITERKIIENKLQQYAERMKAFHDIDQAIMLARSPVEIAEVALDRLGQLIRFDGACVLLIDFKYGKFEYLAVRSPSLSSPCGEPGYFFQCPEYLESLQRGEVFILRQGEQWPPSANDLADRLSRLGISYFISVPLFFKDGQGGAVHFFNRRRMLTSEEIEIAREMVSLLALALQDAHLLEKVTRSENELRILAQRLEEAEEKERRRLSRELHDEVGQNISALGINLQLIKDGGSHALEARVQERLDETISLVETVAAQVRSITMELRSPVLDDYGLLAALRLLGQQFSTRTGLRVTVLGDEVPRSSMAKETALFRVSREALTNVVKHAQAHTVTIDLNYRDRTFHLEISDDGKGFDPSATRNVSKGMGLLSMRERVEAFQGRFHIESAPSRGTKIAVEMPA